MLVVKRADSGNQRTPAEFACHMLFTIREKYSRVQTQAAESSGISESAASALSKRQINMKCEKYIGSLDTIQTKSNFSLLFQERTAVIGKHRYLQAEGRPGRDFKGRSALKVQPFCRPRELDLQGAGDDLHQFFGIRIETVFARKHDAECFFTAVRKEYRAAGHLAVKIDIGLLNNCNILKFRHSVSPSMLEVFLVFDKRNGLSLGDQKFQRQTDKNSTGYPVHGLLGFCRTIEPFSHGSRQQCNSAEYEDGGGDEYPAQQNELYSQ